MPNPRTHLCLGLLGAAFCLTTTAFAVGAPTYSRDVAPIFFDKCVHCHRPAEVAPMSLLTYAEARPWAKSIARAVRNRDMPPWSGESDRHRWQNDLSLSDEEIATITTWVQQGAREGDPNHLPEAPSFPDGWVLGEPDYVLTLDEVQVPAGGEDLFLKQTIRLELSETRWVRAIEFLPGDRRVTHHFQTLYSSPGVAGGGEPEAAEPGRGGNGILGVWTAGMPPFVFPDGMGRILTPGTRILIDSHYHPFGEPASDVTRIGLHFGEGKLEREVATIAVVNTGIRIPPGASDHAERGFFVADTDLQLLAFSPHMHVRGKAMSYDITYPDGGSETLLDVPKYNYNWQWLYYPTEPIDVPAGSRIDVTAVWDNSAANPSNPDPSKEIIYRGDTFNEMFVGFMEVVRKDGTYHQPRKPVERLADLIATHPADASFLVQGFIPFAFHAPRQGEGILYLVQGLMMMTITLDDIHWSGNDLRIVTHTPTPEASATTTLIEGSLDDEGRFKGTLEIGTDTARPFKMPIVGLPTGNGDQALSTVSVGR